jgi:ribosomal protein S18 acetylase RimI-like enzyme
MQIIYILTGDGSMEIRLATVIDVDQIAILFIEQFDIQATFNPYIIQSGTQSKQFIESVITNANADIFVAELSEKIIGFACVSVKESSDFNFMVPHKYARLMEIIVTKDHQGKGIATKLMNVIKQWSLDRELDHIELSVYTNNSAVNFYTKHGYVETEKTMIYRL